MTKKNLTNLILKYFIFLFLLIIIPKFSHAEEVFEIQAEKMSYKKNGNIIYASGNAIARNQLGETLSADKITFYKEDNLITSNGNSKFTDETKNTLAAEIFKYNLKTKTIEAQNKVILIDQKGNQFLLSRIIYNHRKKRGYGYNIKAFTADGSYSEAIEGEIDQAKQSIILKKSKFTTCDKIFDKGKFCPAWSLVSDQIKHDKKNKKIIHKNSFLKIKNIPVLYAPYISHPDPSVKRQSGFLPPSIKTISNIGRTIKIPYFKVISKDKDLTITPTYYFDENSLIQASYRQATKDGFFQAEIGYTQGYNDHNKFGRTKGSRNFYFANYKANKKNIIFDKSEIELNIQRLSQENFLKVNKINTKLFDESISMLENSFRIESYSSNKKIDIEAGIYENLTVNDNSKYTYYFPSGIFSINSLKKNYNLNYNSYFQGKKFNNNQKQAYIKNNLSVNSKDFLLKSGINNKLKFAFYNQNNYNKYFGENKDKLKINNNLTFALHSEVPYAKFSKNSYQIISPKIFLKHTTGSMQTASSNDKILNFSDIFAMNRTNSLDAIETGTSIGYGINYNYTGNFLDKQNKKLTTSFGIGQVLRDVKENKMPVKSSLNKKSSDYAGFFNFNLGNKDILDKNKNSINIEYKFNLDDNLKNLFRNNLNIKQIYNSHQINVTFDEQNHHIGNNRNLTIGYKKEIGDNYYLNIENKKDLINDRSEYKRLSINFENECIITSLSYSQDYYNDKDLKSTKSLIFGVTIKPFQESLGPDLSNFIN